MNLRYPVLSTRPNVILYILKTGFRAEVILWLSTDIRLPATDWFPPRDYSSPNAGIMQDGAWQSHIKMNRSLQAQAAITVKKVVGYTVWRKTFSNSSDIPAHRIIKQYMLERRVERKHFPNNCAMSLVNNIHKHVRQKSYVIDSATAWTTRGTGTHLQVL